MKRAKPVKRRRPRTSALWLVLPLAWGISAGEQPWNLGEPPARPPEEARYVQRAIPDVLLQRSNQPALRLSETWQDKPILLTFVFSRCARICSPFLQSLKSAVESVGGCGKNYQVVVVSFDPGDTPGDMQATAQHLRLDRTPGWIFATATPDDLRRLAPAVGFWYRWDEAQKQFDHPAMLAAIERGRYVRLLVGGTVAPVRLREVLEELRGGWVPVYPLPGRAAFRCFQYNRNGAPTPDWGMLLLIVPGLAAVLVTLGIFRRARSVSCPTA